MTDHADIRDNIRLGTGKDSSLPGPDRLFLYEALMALTAAVERLEQGQSPSSAS
jgi:hypothetical protein